MHSNNPLSRLRVAYAAAAMTSTFVAVEMSDAFPTDVTAITLAPRGIGNGTAPGIQVGELYDPSGDGRPRPAIWTGTAGSVVDLTTPTIVRGALFAADGNMQGGYATTSASVGGLGNFATTSADGPFEQIAALWRGTPQSYVSIRPITAAYSAVRGMKDGVQVGYAGRQYDTLHAAKWNGSAESFVDLHPAGYRQSIAYDTDGTHHVGAVQSDEGGVPHAALWTGSSSDFVDLGELRYAGGSRARSVAGNEQVGYFGAAGDNLYNATYDGVSVGQQRAAVWYGTANSVVDFTPAGASGGDIFSTIGGVEVGVVFFGDSYHAALWLGTPDSFVDLHLSIADTYILSMAKSVTRVGDELQISGVAYDGVNGASAILWTVHVPEPTCLAPLIGLATMLRRTRGERC